MAEWLTRATPADLEVRDGRTVFGLVMPFDREAVVNDGRGDYREVFRRGAFARSLSEHGAGRVKFLSNHQRLVNPLGRASVLREDTAGLYGEFRVSKTVAGDEALELVRDGALDAFSVGFKPVRDGTGTRGLTERIEVALSEVSITAFPAYVGAAVAGVRSAVLLPAEAHRHRLRLLKERF